jgi:WD40 repeat protein
MERERLRVFVSSPGDVATAREVAAQIIEKLSHDYTRFFDIEPYLWEYEPMLASGHFQDSIEPPSQFDAVILILESRLGSPLPERTAVREYHGYDGRTPVTGTEWEFEEALISARDRGAPDLLVYRGTRKTEVDSWDPASRLAVMRQLEALDSFWTRHFADRESFIAGYARFKDLEEFAGKLEGDLRRCIERRIRALEPKGREPRVRIWPKSPFRGLESYEFEHSPIYFGRDGAVGTAMLRLIENAQAGRAFLLVLGASGSGKSSLVKAGILPRLLVPQRVSGVAFLRRLVFRPSDVSESEDLFDALARCLTKGDREEIGLPELLGHSMNLTDFAAHLRNASAHPDLPFAMVLDSLAAQAQDQGRILRYQKARLVLVVDQIEELFTSERIRDDERKRFVVLLANLVRSKLVWVLATMRADFWHRAAELPELIELADGFGRLDLLPPAPAELSQMIRSPAEATNIGYETHPSTGIPLNDLIAQEAAAEPGALPLMSYLLDQLYQRDVHEGGGNMLTYAGYNALGGLKGAIATRADAVLAAQPLEVQMALRQVLFALAQMSIIEGHVERAVARRAPLSDFQPGTDKRRLVDALLNPSARLLIADSLNGHTATVRLAHEALISEWQTARDFVSANTDALKIRRRLEERCIRWQRAQGLPMSAEADVAASRHSTAKRLSGLFGREQGLLVDIDLADARRLVRDYHDELALDLVAFIERSVDRDSRRRRRAIQAVSAIAILMAGLAIAAAYEERVASREREGSHQALLRSLTQTASARLAQANVDQALGMVLEVLADKSMQGVYTPEALSVFQTARAMDAQVQVITGHADRVYSADWSPDGRRVVTASADRTARIWDSATGQQLVILKGHSERVQGAAFSPDGHRIVSASWDKTARIWDASTGSTTLTLQGHSDRVETAEFSPDGQRVLTSSRDKTARIWNANTGELISVLVGHQDRVYSADYSRDGSRIVTASADQTARVWDAATGRQIAELNGHSEAVSFAAFSPDGRRIVTASSDHTARIWDSVKGTQLIVLRGHTDEVMSAAFSPDARRVATASDDMTIRVWDTTTGQQLQLLRGHTGFVFTAMFSPDGLKLVTASDDKTVRIWDTVSSLQTKVLEGHSGAILDAAFSPDGERVATASADRSARIWNAQTGVQLTELDGHTDGVAGAEFSPEGNLVITASVDKTSRIWDVNTGRQLAVLNGDAEMVAASFSPNAQRVVTASYDGTACIWDPASARRLVTLTGHSDRVVSASFSRDGQKVVTASDDKTARIWDVASGRQLVELRGHTDRLLSAAFSPDGRRVVTASNDNSVRIWDASTGKTILFLVGHTGPLDFATFSPDGRLIVTTSDDKTARLWDSETGQQLSVISGHSDRVEMAAFSPDNLHIVTASDDNTARIWDVRTPALSTQLLWASAAQFDDMPARERFDLGLPKIAGSRKWLSDGDRCDELAAAPYDPDRRGPGVLADEINADAASEICRFDSTEDAGRILYQHGRALAAGRHFSAAKREFEQALADGYRVAGIDLAMLLSQPSAELTDVPRTIDLYQRAYNKGVTIAAYELGTLFEHGIEPANGTSRPLLTPDPTRAWLWYRKGADAMEPHALARMAQEEQFIAASEKNTGKRNQHLLGAFALYAIAVERAQRDGWPAELSQEWRYRRASLARILERQDMMDQVAQKFSLVKGTVAN